MQNKQIKVCLVLLLVWTGLYLILCLALNAYGQVPQNKVAVLGFGATWCPNCPRMKPIWQTSKAEVIDIDQRPDLAAKFGVGTTVPTTLIVYTTPDKPKNIVVHTLVRGVSTQAKINTYIAEAKEAR